MEQEIKEKVGIGEIIEKELKKVEVPAKDLTKYQWFMKKVFPFILLAVLIILAIALFVYGQNSAPVDHCKICESFNNTCMRIGGLR